MSLVNDALRKVESSEGPGDASASNGQAAPPLSAPPSAGPYDAPAQQSARRPLHLLAISIGTLAVCVPGLFLWRAVGHEALPSNAQAAVKRYPTNPAPTKETLDGASLAMVETHVETRVSNKAALPPEAPPRDADAPTPAPFANAPVADASAVPGASVASPSDGDAMAQDPAALTPTAALRVDPPGDAAATHAADPTAQVAAPPGAGLTAAETDEAINPDASTPTAVAQVPANSEPPAPSAAKPAIAPGSVFLSSVDVPGNAPITLEAIIWSSHNPVALINGGTATPGAVVGEVQIRAIETRRVELRHKGVTFYVRLP